MLRRSLLRQDFLAQILICLPSRLRRALSFVWLSPHGCWGGGASWVLSPFQDILIPFPCDTVSKQRIILPLHTPLPATRPVPQIGAASAKFFQISILTPPHLPDSERTRAPCLCYFSNFPSASNSEGEHRARTVAATIAHQHADEMTVRVKHKPVSRQAGVAPPRVIALWLLVTIVLLCSQALTSGDKGQRGK